MCTWYKKSHMGVKLDDFTETYVIIELLILKISESLKFFVEFSKDKSIDNKIS